MVKINSSNEETLFTVTLEPNRSLDWKYSLVFIFIIAITCLSVGFAFYFVGATLILPFAGLEILLVAICVYFVMNQSYQKEVIILSPEKLRIEKGKRKAEQTWEFFRSWAQIRVERPKHPWYPAHILVASKGERIPIASLLTQEEKNTLVERLREIINQLSS